MNRYFLIAGVVIIFVFSTIMLLFVNSTPDKPLQVKKGEERRLKLSLTLQNKTRALIQEPKVWVFAPVYNASFHEVVSINSTEQYKINTDKHGNQIISFTLDRLAPFASKVLSIEFVVGVNSSPAKREPADLQLYLIQEQYVEINNEKLISLAKKLKGDSDYETAKNTFNWVNKNLKYAGYIENNRGALYAYISREGDCTEYMYLFTALMRINGVPSRNVGGYTYKDNAVLKAEDYHNWSEVYVDGVWQVVDPQRGIFMANQQDYVAFRIIADTDKLPALFPENTQKFAASDQRIHISIN